MDQRYSPAVMSSRIEPLDSLDFFPTPPYGTRAFMEFVFPKVCNGPASAMTAWEPASGEGHMAEPLREYFAQVRASDVHDYGKGYEVGSFVGQGNDVIESILPMPDWIITNPPFTLAEAFVQRAIGEAKIGVAVLARTVFIESASRYPLFNLPFFRAFCPFSSRLSMCKGRCDPKASSATSYSWFVFVHRWNGPGRVGHDGAPQVILIPPDAKERCTRPDDVARFGK